VSKNGKAVTEDTIITIGQDIPLEKYRAFFRKTIEGFAPEIYCGDFQSWLKTHTGKTLREAIEDYHNKQPSKNMEEILEEHRFSIISETDKDFISAFDKEIIKLGYDFSGKIGSGFVWGPYMIVWSKVGVQAKKVAARIFIRDNHIVLRLFFGKVDAHQTYIENAPAYIKEVFLEGHGDCNCNPEKEDCRMRKTYTIDGKQIKKCSGVVYEFYSPTIEKLSDYVGLLSEFYPIKKAKRA